MANKAATPAPTLPTAPAPTAPPAPAPAPAPQAAAAKPETKRVEPQITGINTSLKMPEPPKAGRRGSKTLFPFDDLEVGTSFGVKNKTLEQMQSIISNQNKKSRVEKRDEAGNIVYKTKSAKAADGSEIQVPTDEPETVEGKRFFGIACDPKTDPEGAQVRVWRQK